MRLFCSSSGANMTLIQRAKDTFTACYQLISQFEQESMEKSVFTQLFKSSSFEKQFQALDQGLTTLVNDLNLAQLSTT
jgi:hypothetical protein